MIDDFGGRDIMVNPPLGYARIRRFCLVELVAVRESLSLEGV
jgi:hypothetical protein